MTEDAVWAVWRMLDAAEEELGKTAEAMTGKAVKRSEGLLCYLV